MFDGKKVAAHEIEDLEASYLERPSPELARRVALIERDWATSSRGYRIDAPHTALTLLYSSTQFSLLAGDLAGALETASIGAAHPDAGPHEFRALLVEAHGRRGDVERAIALATDARAGGATADDYFDLSSAFGIIAIHLTPPTPDGEVADRPLYERLAAEAERFALLAIESGRLAFPDIARGFVYSARRAQGKPLDAADQEYLAGSADRDPRYLLPFGSDWG